MTPTAQIQDLQDLPQHDQPIADVTRRGLAIYRDRLQAVLEPEHADRVVAIRLDSGDYTVANSSPDALRAMRRVHPSGLLFLYTIGPASDLGLARRMSGLSAGARRGDPRLSLQKATLITELDDKA